MSERLYIAIGPKCWGKGTTTKTAVACMKRNLPSMVKSGDYQVWSCPEGSRVTEHGLIGYPKDAPTPPFVVSNGNLTIGGGLRK